MESGERLRQQIKTEIAGRSYTFLECTDSTNEWLKARCESLPHGYAVLAGEQTRGKGRLGRSWAAPAGQSMLLSVLFKPDTHIPETIFPLVCALAATEALESLCGGGFCIKWPNDILCSGKKVCGILCESRLADGRQNLICGIGINLLEKEEFFISAGLPGAASVRMLKGKAPTAEAMAAEVLDKLEHAYSELCTQGSRQAVDSYRKACITLGRQVCAQNPDRVILGKAADILEDGALLLITAAGPVSLYSGDVTICQGNEAGGLRKDEDR